MRQLSVLLLRSPVSSGTDPYHDVYGPLCVPPLSATTIDSAGSTPRLIQNRFAGNSLRIDDSCATALNTTLSDIPPSDPIAATDNPQTWLMTHHKGKIGDSEREFCVTSFPVLAHRKVSIDDLAAVIAAPQCVYDGVIITSQRAVESWVDASHVALHALNARDASDTPWTSLPFYTVGPATSNTLRNAPFPSVLAPNNVVGDENTGTGEKLADVISRQPALKRLLYLVGDKTSPGLARTLAKIAPDIRLDYIRVYETCQEPNLGSYISLLARNLPDSNRNLNPSSENLEQRRPEIQQSSPKPSCPDWIAFFSPSGGKYVLPFLKEFGWIGPDRAKIACIGPTTASWVNETLGVEPDAVAAAPTPAGLQDAIVNATAMLHT